MNRRSFLQFLGLAPIAPTVLAATSIADLEAAEKLANPLICIDTSNWGDALADYGRGPMLNALPDARLHDLKWKLDFNEGYYFKAGHEHDRISAPL